MALVPLVSVIIPIYNAKEWIAETIHSALAQTYPCLELILVDDASTDGTHDVLETFRSPKTRILYNTNNRGVSSSRNRAISVANGDYVALLDHDDLWFPEKIAKQLALFKANPALGLVYSDCFNQTPDGKGSSYFEEWHPHRGQTFKALLTENFIPCLTAVIPRKVLTEVGTFRTDLRMAEEYELFLRIAKRYPMDFVDEPLGIYRIQPCNISRNREAFYKDRIIYLNLYRRDFPCADGELALSHMGLARQRLRNRPSTKWLFDFLKGFGLALAHPFQFSKVLAMRSAQKKSKK